MKVNEVRAKKIQPPLEGSGCCTWKTLFGTGRFSIYLILHRYWIFGRWTLICQLFRHWIYWYKYTVLMVSDNELRTKQPTRWLICLNFVMNGNPGLLYNVWWREWFSLIMRCLTIRSLLLSSSGL